MSAIADRLMIASKRTFLQTGFKHRALDKPVIRDHARERQVLAVSQQSPPEWATLPKAD
jgi:hypothetical protein